jgi:pimeloyl-ACP methyl ester carboxylesterase/acyl carrier protein
MAEMSDPCRKPVAGPGFAAATDLAVAEVFRKVFDLGGVQADDDFFRLGGDSLLADTLMMGIEREFGVEFPISALVEAPTPRKLANLIREKRSDNCNPNLLVARDTGSRPPLVCVHGTDGDSLSAMYFAEMLAPDRKIFGFRAFGLEEGERPFATIEEMADAYIGAYRTNGEMQEPILLLGHCAGTMIAYEMAQKFLAQGRDVAGIVLIDPEIGKGALFLGNPALAAARRSLEKARRYAWHRRHAESRPRPVIGERRNSTKRAMQFAVRCYVPEPLVIPCLFIVTPARRELANPRRGFPTLLPNCEIVEIDAIHHELFTGHAAELSILIDRFLQRVDRFGLGQTGLQSA